MNIKRFTSPSASLASQDIIDIIIINKQLSFTLKASATFVISLYPTSVISGKAVLNGGSALNKAYAKPLSGKNVAPVIIQTSQAVKGITKG
jgi:hypothetical protein